ncbi:MAG TPA: sigma-54 dependent transcriptional regulator [Candidatus Polarisedimenticolaceae bacterium]|nr:sigma-54 dependent transcriptional regulator [Candidatus Polarisedimenticolaceae bacterium]
MAAPSEVAARAARVLVADDRPDVREALRLLLRPEGFEVEVVGSPAGVLAALEARDFDVVLIDLNYTRDTTSGEEGLDLLRRIRALDAHLPVVVMTAWGSVELAVEAMRRGARDFVEKPWDNARLLATLRTQTDLGRALRSEERFAVASRLATGDGDAPLVAESAAMTPVLELVERIGPSDANVLITGENGTGKGRIARALHAVSARSLRPFVVVNVVGLAEGVFESELFGHVRGAFTDARADRIGRLEAADGGTLFLDEIGHLPAALQAKLLRVLERGEFERVGSSATRRLDLRIVSATNAELDVEVREGRFRQDLLFRLNTIEIRLPPLRARREDVVPLANSFLARAARRYGRDVRGFEPEAYEAMVAHPWPGNVRELEHAVERAVLLASGSAVREPDLRLRPPATASGTTPVAGGLAELSLEEVERLLIRKALDRHGGNVKQAADALGLSRSALYRRLQRHGL